MATRLKNLMLKAIDRKAPTVMGSDVVAQANLQHLAATIQRFNTIAQNAYDSSVRWQRAGIAGTIIAKFAKVTLKEVVANAISTFGSGAMVDVGFSQVSEAVKGDAVRGFDTGWSADNLMGKGWDYALGGNGGYGIAGDSGLSRLQENFIKAGIGWGIGLIQDKLTDEFIEKVTTGDDELVNKYIDDNIDLTSPIAGARKAIKSLPTLNSANSTVRLATDAHLAKKREGTSELIKEAVHQIDQLCYALNELDALANAEGTFAANNRGRFRKCREMVEFMGKMYWFRRKYNKTKHFLDQLKADYVALGMILSEMEKFWRTHLRDLEMLAMRAASKDATVSKSSGGQRTHLMTDLIDNIGTKQTLADGREVTKLGKGSLTSGQRNWRTVKPS